MIPFTAGWILTIWAQNLAMLIVSRVFIGIAGGAFCVAGDFETTSILLKMKIEILNSFFSLHVAPMYIGEQFRASTWKAQ